ncbi:MAG: ABC transporter permease, partial [Bacteroidota bacterium]
MKAIWFKLMQDSRFYKLKVFYLWLAQVLAFFGLSMVFFSDIMVNRDFEENYARSQSAHLIMTTDAVQPDDAWPLANDPRLPIVEARPMQAGEVQVRPDRFMKALFIGVADIDHPQVNRFFRQDQRAGVQIYIEQNGAYFFDSLYLENLRLVRPNNDTLTLGPAGQVHDTRLPPSRMEHTIYVFLPIARFRTYFPHASSRWLVRTELDPGDPARLRALGQEVQADWMETYAEALRVSVASQEHPHQNIADGIFYLIKLLGSSLGMLGGIFMVLILLTWLYPQIPDMGTLKSLGATRTSIQGAYFLFVFVLGLLAWVPGVSLGYLAAQAFNAFIAFTQNFSPVDTPVSFWQWGTLFGISLAIPLLLSWYPVHSAVRKRVRYAQELVFTTGARAITWLGGRFPTARWSYLSNNMFRNLVLLSLTMLMVVGG